MCIACITMTMTMTVTEPKLKSKTEDEPRAPLKSKPAITQEYKLEVLFIQGVLCHHCTPHRYGTVQHRYDSCVLCLMVLAS